jgi:hypothetical protein
VSGIFYLGVKTAISGRTICHAAAKRTSRRPATQLIGKISATLCADELPALKSAISPK